MTQYIHTLYIFLSLVLMGGLPLCAQVYESSPLSVGHWGQVSVRESGAYRISFDQLRSAGIENPAEVRIFGQGGRMLSEELDDHTLQLRPVPIHIEGDMVYFYGEGVVEWRADAASGTFSQTPNVYSTSGYYLVTDRTDLPRATIDRASAVSPSTSITVDSYIARLVHEEELFSPRSSGRRLFGEPLNTPSPLRLSFQLPGEARSEAAKLGVCYMGLPTSSSAVTLSVDVAGQKFSDEVSSPGGFISWSYLAGISRAKVLDLAALSGSTVTVDMQTTPRSQSAFLDYVTLSVPVALQHKVGRQLDFRNFSPSPGQVALHAISTTAGVEALRLWGRSADGVVQRLDLQSRGGGVSFVGSMTDAGGVPVEYLLFAPQDAYPVQSVRQIANQDLLSGVKGQVPDYVIITPDLLRPEAERLAQYHREHSGLCVQVATQREIFNEFSSGTPDATAYRLLMKHHKLRYEAKNGAGSYHPLLLLFGDGAYDNRKVSREWQSASLQQTEFLLTYQGYNSLDVNSYTCDDYFGLLESGQRGKTVGRQEVGVGIGRLPIRTLQQAQQMVDKLIRYDSERQSGAWRTRTCYVADNMDGYSHARQADEVATYMEQLRPELMVSKVYLDAFAREVEAGRTSVPGAKRKIMDELTKGVLLLDYTGHGGPAAWADEQIMTTQDIVRSHYEHLPVWITATCDFTNFDAPATSAGEEAMLNPYSGAIALYTTTRVVFDQGNKRMNLALHKSLFTPEDDGRLRPMGLVMRDAKNALLERDPNRHGDTINKLNFLLIGDPALRLRMPSQQAVITEINGQSVADAGGAINLYAMDKVRIKGLIADGQSVTQGDFSGSLFVTVFNAKERAKTLLENDPSQDPDNLFSYDDYPGVLYAGVADVRDGFFDFTFVVPKDLSYAESNGKINLYAYSDREVEAMGVDHSIRVVPGVGEHSTIDTVPPEIRRLYIGHPDFSLSSPVGATPLFFAELADESGINLSGTGIGHNMALQIDGRADLTFVLNNHYTASQTEAGVGVVLYQLPQLEEGDHKAVFTVWDVFNNCTRRELLFRVDAGQAPMIVESRAVPTIVHHGEQTVIEIYNNTPGVEAEVSVELYDYRGRIVSVSPTTIVRTGYEAPAKIYWTPSDYSGGSLPTGLYLYRLRMTVGTSQPAFSTGKIVIQ